MFEVFIMCVTLHASIICNNNAICIADIKDCVLDGETIEFCAMYEKNVKYIDKSLCKEYIE